MTAPQLAIFLSSAPFLALAAIFAVAEIRAQIVVAVAIANPDRGHR